MDKLTARVMEIACVVKAGDRCGRCSGSFKGQGASVLKEYSSEIILGGNRLRATDAADRDEPEFVLQKQIASYFRNYTSSYRIFRKLGNPKLFSRWS